MSGNKALSPSAALLGLRTTVASAIATAPLPYRVVSPESELGAYDALWARQDGAFKSVAEAFGAHQGATPSD